MRFGFWRLSFIIWAKSGKSGQISGNLRVKSPDFPDFFLVLLCEIWVAIKKSGKN